MTRAHEAHEHLWHAEITQAPREASDNRHCAGSVYRRFAKQRHAVFNNLQAIGAHNRLRRHSGRKEARDVLQERDGVFHAARHADAAHKNHHERANHDRTLNKVGRAYREVSTHEGVHEHDEGAQNHHGGVVEPEQRGEKLAARYKAAAAIDAEEQQNNDGRDAHENAAIIMEAVAEKIGQSDGVAGNLRILAQTSRHELPIQIRANGEADCSPHGIGSAREIGNARQTHEQPARHVGCLGRKRCEPGAQASAAKEIVLGR